MKFIDYSPDAKVLLNPAFCGMCLLSFIQAFQKENGKGVPLSLLYILLPLVLHKKIRENLPRTKSTSLAVWVQENPTLAPTVAEKALALKIFTGTAISHLLNSQLIQIQNGLFVQKQSDKGKPLRIPSSESSEVKEIFLKAELVGRWLAKSGSDSMIFTILGLSV